MAKDEAFSPCYLVYLFSDRKESLGDHRHMSMQKGKERTGSTHDVWSRRRKKSDGTNFVRIDTNARVRSKHMRRWLLLFFSFLDICWTTTTSLISLESKMDSMGKDCFDEVWRSACSMLTSWQTEIKREDRWSDCCLPLASFFSLSLSLFDVGQARNGIAERQCCSINIDSSFRNDDTHLFLFSYHYLFIRFFGIVVFFPSLSGRSGRERKKEKENIIRLVLSFLPQPKILPASVCIYIYTYIFCLVFSFLIIEQLSNWPFLLILSKQVFLYTFERVHPRDELRSISKRKKSKKYYTRNFLVKDLFFFFSFIVRMACVIVCICCARVCVSVCLYLIVFSRLLLAKHQHQSSSSFFPLRHMRNILFFSSSSSSLFDYRFHRFEFCLSLVNVDLITKWRFLFDYDGNTDGSNNDGKW